MNFFKKYWSKLTIMTEKITEISYEDWIKEMESDRGNRPEDDYDLDDIDYDEIYQQDVFSELNFED